MKRIVLSVLFILYVLPFSLAQQKQGHWDTSTFGFIENKGQITDQFGNLNSKVLFLLNAEGINVQLRQDGFSYDTYQVLPGLKNASPKSAKYNSEDIQKRITNYHRVDISFVGSSDNHLILPGQKSTDEIRYNNGPEITTHHFKEVVYQGIYPNIDVRFYIGENGKFEYDFVVAPGADPSNIQLRYDGQNSISKSDKNELLLNLAHGDLTESIPVSYLKENGSTIDISYQQIKKNTFQFSVPSFDTSKTLIIDPTPNRIWSTYFGGILEDSGESVSVDNSDNVYISGYTYSSAMATAGAFQTTLSGTFDGFIAKFNSSGVRQFSTYVGGPADDYIWALLVDGSGNIYATGSTTSSSGLATSGVQQQFIGGLNDAILMKFNSSGARTWGTYFGGTEDDYAFDITLNSAGQPVIGGRTESVDMVMLSGSQSIFGGGTSDAFYAAFDPTSGVLARSSYLGGTTADGAVKIIGDGSGNIFLAGWSNSTSGIATSGTFSSTQFGLFDAFLVKFNSSGGKSWGTYLGGAADDEGYGLTLDGTGAPYLSGYTESSGINAGGANPGTYMGGQDIFIAKFNTSNGLGVWSSYYGGIGDEIAWSLVADDNNIYGCGETTSTADMATPLAYQTTIGGGYDAVFFKYDLNGAKVYGSYYGGLGEEYAKYNSIDASGNIIFVGLTSSTSGIASTGSHQGTYGGGNYDAFVAKFDNVTLAAEPTAQPTNLTVVALNTDNFTYDITAAAGVTGGYIHIYKAGSAPTALPVDGVEYFQDDLLPDGSTVRWVDNLTAGNFYGGLTAGTTYYIKIFSFNGTGTTTNYLTTNPLSATITTTGGTITIPTISSFSPLSGIAGSSVTITGTNFSTTPASNIVYFGAMKATVSAATATQLTVTVPTGASYQPIGVTVNGLTAYSIKPYILTFTGSGTIDVNSFAAKVDVTVGATNFNNQLSVGDFDGDSKTDVAVANQLGTAVSLIRNTSTSGSIAFAAFVGIATGATPQGVTNVDLDGDGKLDIVAVNNGSNSISAFRNISTSGTLTTSSFATKLDFATGTAPVFCASGDLDLDGKTDLVVSNSTGNSVSVLKNQSTSGSITFAAKVDVTTDASPRGIALGDIDGDGKLDVIVASYSAATFSIFRNTTSGAAISFASAVVFAAGTGTSPQGLAIGDLNADGKADLAISNDAGATASIFTNTSVPGSLSFSNGPVLTTGARAFNLTIGDLDGDGKPDLAVASNSANTVSLFKNTTTASTISFSTKVDFATGLNPTSIGINDLDGDGKVELMVSNSNNPTVSIFRNTSVSATAPTISGFNPTSGSIGTSVTITGTNFSTTPASNMVMFNGTTAIATASTATSITTTVPSSATTGTISVTVGGLIGTSSGSFTVTTVAAPTITNFNPTSGPVGTSVTITGTNFSTTPANNTVKFNSTTATVTASTATSITTSVPTGATTGSITVTVGSQTATSSSNFTVTTVTLATEPTAQPTNLVFSNQTNTGFDYVFTAATGTPAGYIVLRSTGVAVTGAPVDGTTYSVGDALGNAFVRSTTAVGGTANPVSGLTPLTSYHLAIFAFNGSGSTINYRQVSPLTGSTTTLSGVDTTEPFVNNNTTPTSVAKGAPVNVTVTLTDAESGISKATIYYASLEDAKDDYITNWNSGTMTKGTGDNYTFTIPGTFVKEMGVTYYFYLENGVGLPNYSSDYSVAVQLTGDGLTIPFTGFGNDQTKYRIVSVPVQATAATANAVFGDDLGTYDKTKWRLFRYQGSTTELNGQSTLQVGNGYWLIASNSATLDTGPGTTPAAAVYDPVVLTLTPGWNQIGNPYPYDVKWQSILDWNGNPTEINKLRTYNGNWQDGSELEKFSGGFVMNAGSSSITIEVPVFKDPTANGRMGSPKMDMKNPIDNQDWSLTLGLEQGGLLNTLGGFGMHHNAKEDYDHFDDFNLPRFTDFVELNHLDKELHHFSYSKDVVPFQENHTWEFSIESNSNESVTMKWDNSFFGANNKELVLWDVNLQRGFNMRNINQYIFNKVSSGHFKVFYGDENYIKEKTVVEQVVFHDVFPNPASDLVTLSFSVPSEDQLTIEVIDLLGRKIATLAEGKFKPGYHELNWNTQDLSGNAIVNGIYITRIKGLNSDQQKRLIINK